MIDESSLVELEARIRSGPLSLPTMALALIAEVRRLRERVAILAERKHRYAVRWDEACARIKELEDAAWARMVEGER